jgi:hypothetical protein
MVGSWLIFEWIMFHNFWLHAKGNIYSIKKTRNEGVLQGKVTGEGTYNISAILSANIQGTTYRPPPNTPITALSVCVTSHSASTTARRM